MPKRPSKPTPLPSPRTAQSPDAAALIARALTPMFGGPMRGSPGGNQPLRPPPMVVPRGKKGRRGR